MSAARETLLSALDAYVHPLIGRGLVAAGTIASAEIVGDAAQVVIELGFPSASIRDELAQELGAQINDKLGLVAELSIGSRIERHAARKNLQPLTAIRQHIAVARGKGGVEVGRATWRDRVGHTV